MFTSFYMHQIIKVMVHQIQYENKQSFSHTRLRVLCPSFTIRILDLRLRDYSGQQISRNEYTHVQQNRSYLKESLNRQTLRNVPITARMLQMYRCV